MLFAIISEDIIDSLPLRMGARPAHIERLQQLQQQDRLILAGPHPLVDEEGFSGSLVVAEFNDLASAQAWADDDPYITAGVYAKVTVKPFKQVLP
jgi:uncharacterized protein YciI